MYYSNKCIIQSCAAREICIAALERIKKRISPCISANTPRLMSTRMPPILPELDRKKLISKKLIALISKTWIFPIPVGNKGLHISSNWTLPILVMYFHIVGIGFQEALICFLWLKSFPFQTFRMRSLQGD